MDLNSDPLAGTGLPGDLSSAPAVLRQAVKAVSKATPGARLPSVSVKDRPRLHAAPDLAPSAPLRTSLVPRLRSPRLPAFVMVRADEALRVARRTLWAVLLSRLLPFPLVPTVPIFAVLDPPLPEDTASTVDAPITPEILELARSLGSDPRRIFYWVRSEIETEVYDGSKKGAVGTLAERSGNDTDQASLLIALLRAAGVPCRTSARPCACPSSWAAARPRPTVTASTLSAWALRRGSRDYGPPSGSWPRGAKLNGTLTVTGPPCGAWKVQRRATVRTHSDTSGSWPSPRSAASVTVPSVPIVSRSSMRSRSVGTRLRRRS